MASIRVAPKTLPTRSVTVSFTGSEEILLNWTPAEQSAGRRLVRIDSVLTLEAALPNFHITFSAVDQGSYVPGMPVISCIATSTAAIPFAITAVDYLVLLGCITSYRFGDGDSKRMRLAFRNLPSEPLESGPLQVAIVRMPPPKPCQKKVARLYSWPGLKSGLASIFGQWFYCVDAANQPIGIAPQLLQQLETQAAARAGQQERARAANKARQSLGKRASTTPDSDPVPSPSTARFTRSPARLRILMSPPPNSPAHNLLALTAGPQASSSSKRIGSPRQSPDKRTKYGDDSDDDDLLSLTEVEVGEPEEEEDTDEPPTPALVSLETFLNNQNPGLGTTCTPFLKRFGITSYVQFSRFRTVDWFNEFFETRLVGQGLTPIDEFLLKKVVSVYLTQ